MRNTRKGEESGYNKPFNFLEQTSKSLQHRLKALCYSNTYLRFYSLLVATCCEPYDSPYDLWLVHSTWAIWKLRAQTNSRRHLRGPFQEQRWFKNTLPLHCLGWDHCSHHAVTKCWDGGSSCRQSCLCLFRTLKPLKLCQHCLEAFGEQEKEKDCLWCISFAGTLPITFLRAHFLRSWSCCSCWQRQEGQEGTKQFPQHCSWVCSILPTLLLQRMTQPNTNNFRTRAAQRNQRKRTFGCELVGDVVSTSSSISYADSQLPVHTQASICTWSAEFEVASNLKTLHVPPGVWEKSGTRNEKVESMQTNLYCISIIQHLYVDNVKTFGSYVMWSRKCGPSSPTGITNMLLQCGR